MPRERPVGLVSAVPFEAGLLLKEIRGAKTPASSVTTGRVGRTPVVHISSGMGAANAARALTLLIEGFSPRLVVVFGIGGAYPGSGLRPGDIVLAEKEIYADTGVLMKDGLHDLRETGTALLTRGGKRYFNDFPLDGRLLRRSLKALGGEARAGVFLTVSQCTGTLRRARELEKRHRGVCENMEGAPAAQICASYGVPMVEIRGISNIVEARDTGKWRRGTAAMNCQKAVIRLLETL